jgi:anti-anti-sigma factor
MSVVLEPAWRGRHVVCPTGPLHVPQTSELDHTMRTRVRRGERHIVLDLAEVSSIDAAGIGVLMRAHRRMAAIDGVVRIVNANRWVREPLQRVGVFRLLSDE